MAMGVREVAALQKQLAQALLSDLTTTFERQFLFSHKARLDQHGTHAMITEDQHRRMAEIFRRTNPGSAKASSVVELRPIHAPQSGLQD